MSRPRRGRHMQQQAPRRAGQSTGWTVQAFPSVPCFSESMTQDRWSGLSRSSCAGERILLPLTGLDRGHAIALSRSPRFNPFSIPADTSGIPGREVSRLVGVVADVEQLGALAFDLE